MEIGQFLAKNNGAENILHCTGVRLRVVGSGNLDMTLYSLDSARTFPMMALPMTPTNERELTRLGNFRSQRIQLGFSVDVIDEYFKISKIIFFAKPSATSYPG